MSQGTLDLIIGCCLVPASKRMCDCVIVFGRNQEAMVQSGSKSRKLLLDLSGQNSTEQKTIRASSGRIGTVA